MAAQTRHYAMERREMIHRCARLALLAACWCYSAKAYAQITRLLWTLEQLRNSMVVEWSRLAAEAGYSDQSHLVRDFRRVGAASPTEYLRKFAPDRDALLEAAG